MVSTHLKNISQNGNLPQIGVKIKNVWNHHLVKFFIPKKIPSFVCEFLTPSVAPNGTTLLLREGVRAPPCCDFVGAKGPPAINFSNVFFCGGRSTRDTTKNRWISDFLLDLFWCMTSVRCPFFICRGETYFSEWNLVHHLEESWRDATFL